MIKYALICRHDHNFEVWFSSSADYDSQRQKRLITCPYCGSAKIDKAIMAPAVSTSRKQESIAQKETDKRAAAMAMMNAAAEAIKAEIAEKCDYVGDKFADEALAIHYGEKDERAIYGEASKKEVADLREEGVGVSPLPDIIAPQRKDKLN